MLINVNIKTKKLTIAINTNAVIAGNLPEKSQTQFDPNISRVVKPTTDKALMVSMSDINILLSWDALFEVFFSFWRLDTKSIFVNTKYVEEIIKNIPKITELSATIETPKTPNPAHKRMELIDIMNLSFWRCPTTNNNGKPPITTWDAPKIQSALMISEIPE